MVLKKPVGVRATVAQPKPKLVAVRATTESPMMAESNRYKRFLEKKMVGGVSLKDADAILADARSGTFQEVNAHYLAGFLDYKKSRFEPLAREKLKTFVHLELQKRALILGDSSAATVMPDQPEITSESKAKGVKLTKWPGVLSIGRFKADEPLQGNLGTCYFISSLIAVANSRPELLENAVKDNGNGTYTVRFFERKPGQTKASEIFIDVDTLLPTRRGQLEYAAARDPKVLWPMVFEKAYAKWKGSYAAIEAGMAATSLEALTGVKGTFFPVTSDMSPSGVFAKLKAGLADKGFVVALSKPWEGAVQGIADDHAYAVLDVAVRDGQQMVKLRNPWGQVEPGNDGKDDGIFWLPINTFLTSYATVELSRVP